MGVTYTRPGGPAAPGCINARRARANGFPFMRSADEGGLSEPHARGVESTPRACGSLSPPSSDQGPGRVHRSSCPTTRCRARAGFSRAKGPGSPRPGSRLQFCMDADDQTRAASARSDPPRTPRREAPPGELRRAEEPIRRACRAARLINPAPGKPCYSYQCCITVLFWLFQENHP